MTMKIKFFLLSLFYVPSFIYCTEEKSLNSSLEHQIKEMRRISDTINNKDDIEALSELAENKFDVWGNHYYFEKHSYGENININDESYVVQKREIFIFASKGVNGILEINGEELNYGSLCNKNDDDLALLIEFTTILNNNQKFIRKKYTKKGKGKVRGYDTISWKL